MTDETDVLKEGRARLMDTETPPNEKEVRLIDGLIDRLSTGVNANEAPTATIIRPYDADRAWLWRRWSGTIGQLTWRAMLLSSLMAAGLCTSVAVTHRDWALWTVPDPNDPLVAFLGNAANVWQFQLTVTTFVMTLFLNEAWSFRGSIYQVIYGDQHRGDLALTRYIRYIQYIIYTRYIRYTRTRWFGRSKGAVKTFACW